MLQTAFDRYALAYDQSFSNSKVGRLQRAAVQWVLQDVLSPGSRILEVNAGTGEDALWFANHGHQVLATDLSPVMVQRIREKTAGVSGVSAKVMNLTSLAHEAPESVQVVFSDFGGLNCVDTDGLRQFLAGAHSVLVSGGLLFLVLMGRKCIWERLYFRIRPSRGNRNRRQLLMGVQTIINNEQFLTWYYSPDEIIKLAGANFSGVRMYPVGLFVPPSYLEPLVNRIPGLLSLLGWLDRRLAHWSAASDYADHYIICMQKEGTT